MNLVQRLANSVPRRVRVAAAVLPTAIMAYFGIGCTEPDNDVSDTDTAADHATEDGSILFHASPAKGEPRQIYRLDLDSYELSQVTDFPEFGASHPIWSPDGSYIVVSKQNGNNGRGSRHHRPYLMAPDGSAQAAIETGAEGDEEDKFAQVTEDGTLVYATLRPFGCDDEGCTAGQVMTADLDDVLGTERAVAGEQYGEGAWAVNVSPDGQKISYVKKIYGQDKAEHDVYVANIDGTNEQRLTNMGRISYSGAEWSPDGKRLVFSSAADTGGENHELYIVDADGNNLTQVLNPELAGHDCVDPVFTNNGEIVFVDRLSGPNRQLAIVGEDGLGLEYLTEEEDFHALGAPDYGVQGPVE